MTIFGECMTCMVVTNLSLIDQPIQSGYLPLEWINKWKHYSSELLPKRWEIV